MPNKQTQHPAHFLDSLIATMKLKNDAALCRAINVKPPAISKIRHAMLPVTPSILLKIHDASAISIADLRAMLYKTCH